MQYQPGETIDRAYQTENITYYAVWERNFDMFSDVPKSAYYESTVSWAVDNDITAGKGTAADGTLIFQPTATCTKAEAVTFLWRLYGRPEPESTVSFADVKSTAYYAKAVAWAVENNIIYGTDASHFSPNTVINRQTVATIIYRAAGSPSAPETTAFTDVPANKYYTNAIAWAVKAGITSGLNETTFGLNAPCTRAQIVTMLYRFAEED